MKKRFLSIAVALLTVVSLLGGCGGGETAAAADPVPEDFEGLVLKAATGCSVFLHTELADGEVIPTSQVYETEEYKYYCFTGLTGTYRYKVNGAGRYTVTQGIVLSQEDGQQKTVIDVTPGKCDNQGWEPKEIHLYSNKALDDCFASAPDMWPDYAPLLTSPWYTEAHNDHQITTQTQMTDYLQGLDDADDDMYLYSAGKSSVYRHDIPLVIFTKTDLSGAKDTAEAAAAMGQDKPTVLYRCQMHGNEPAAGEAALAMIKWLDSSLGEALLDQINICVIPRQSPDGAQNFERLVMGGIDPNRDSLRLDTQEIKGYTETVLLLEPELIIDGHEYKNSPGSKTLGGGDIMLGLGYTPMNTDTFRQFNHEISDRIFGALEGQQLDYCYYTNYVNSPNANVSRGYASMQGTLFVLLETRGIGNGLSMYDRRIVSQLVSAEALLRFAAENADRLQQTVDAERQMIIDKGAVYDVEDKIHLDLGSAEDITLQHTGRSHDQITGVATEKNLIPKVYSAINRERVAPTAYVIPAENSDRVLKLMDLHGIEYTFIPEGSTVRLQQYVAGETVTLTDEKSVTFPEGAYVFCKNQVRGYILSMLMEPDVDDLAEQKGTLVQQGLLTAAEGKYPIYRYVHDLNSEGFIDYR